MTKYWKAGPSKTAFFQYCGPIQTRSILDPWGIYGSLNHETNKEKSEVSSTFSHLSFGVIQRQMLRFYLDYSEKLTK